MSSAVFLKQVRISHHYEPFLAYRKIGPELFGFFSALAGTGAGFPDPCLTGAAAGVEGPKSPEDMDLGPVVTGTDGFRQGGTAD